MADVDETTRQWLRLHLTDQVGATTFRRLLEHFGNIEAALNATPGQLAKVPYISRKKAEGIVAERDDVDVDDEIALAQKLGVRILTLHADDYPAPLKNIPDPPPVLYVKGQLRREDNLAMAIVGMRSCSIYGREQASRLGHLLAAAGFTIVSGLARGIDTAAHQGALTAQGRTIAVQGRGLAEVFPPENEGLAVKIAASGAVISEFPLRYEPLAKTFPMRNRIIAGLTLGTIVVQAQQRSGALITARLAGEYNREVMAVPGAVDHPGSQGPHRLIKDGAVLVENIQDVLDGLGQLGDILHKYADHEAQAATTAAEESQTRVDAAALKLSTTEQKVLAALDHETRHIDGIIEATGLTAAPATAALTALQLKGVVQQLPGGYYRRR